MIFVEYRHNCDRCYHTFKVERWEVETRLWEKIPAPSAKWIHYGMTLCEDCKNIANNAMRAVMELGDSSVPLRGEGAGMEKTSGAAAVPRAGPYEPPMVYDPQQGIMIKPGSKRGI